MAIGAYRGTTERLNRKFLFERGEAAAGHPFVSFREMGTGRTLVYHRGIVRVSRAGPLYEAPNKEVALVVIPL